MIIRSAFWTISFYFCEASLIVTHSVAPLWYPVESIICQAIRISLKKDAHRVPHDMALEFCRIRKDDHANLFENLLSTFFFHIVIFYELEYSWKKLND